MIKTAFTNLGIFIMLLFIVPASFAAEMQSGEHIVLPADAVIEDNYFAAGDSVTISGTINGDLYVAGGTVTIEGTINGDLLAAGGNINIRGTVSQDVRVAGGQLIVSGVVGRNLTVLGGSVTVTDAAEITGSVVGAGGSLQLFAPIPGSVTLAGGDVELGSTIGGDVVAAVGNLKLTPSGIIGGNLTYYSDEEVNIPQGATVSGQIIRREYPEQARLDAEEKENIEEAARVAAVMAKVLNVLSAFILGTILLLVFPKYTTHITTRITKSVWPSLGLGFLMLIFVPILAIILFITVIGIPLGFLLLFAYFFSLYIAKIFISLVLGEKILGYINQKYHPVAVLAVGLIVYLMLTSIPVIGWLVSVFAVLIGLGSMYLAKKDYYQEAKAKKMV